MAQFKSAFISGRAQFVSAFTAGSTYLPIKFNQPKRHFISNVYRTIEYLISDDRYGMFEVPNKNIFTSYYYKMLMQGDL